MTHYPYDMTERDWDYFKHRTNGKIDTQSVPGCWIWTGTVAGSGQGVMSIRNKLRNIRKVVYAKQHPEYDTELALRAECGNPRCINPAHMHPTKYRSAAMEKRYGDKPTRMLTAFDNETKSVDEWLKDPRVVVNRAQLLARLSLMDNGMGSWDADSCLTYPVRTRITKMEKMLAPIPERKRKVRSDAVFTTEERINKS